jgi:uncharacterized OB-fold protein
VPEPIRIYVCKNRHTSFENRDACATCATPLEAFSADPEAALISHTTVRVNPTGEPFVLGMAEIASGAKTLCVVEGEIGERVVLYRRDGLYYAGPRD